jgi:hypothetical protein
VTAVLEALEKIGMKVNSEKSVFHVTEMEYLGYIMSPGSVKMDSKKI